MNSEHSVDKPIEEPRTNQEPKMRAFLSVILCLSMAAYIMAEFKVGERQEGDYVFVNKTIFRYPILWKHSTAVIVVKAPHDARLSYVKISNIGDTIAEFIQMPTGPYTKIVKVMALGNLGEGIYVRVEASAVNIITPPKSTEPEDTKTEEYTSLSSSEE